jgi:hypothetical protein
VPTVARLKLHCDVCAQLRPFELPPCVEGHGTDCPDWACTGCGSAVFLAPTIMLVDRIAPVVLRKRAHRTHRHAA